MGYRIFTKKVIRFGGLFYYSNLSSYLTTSLIITLGWSLLWVQDA